MSLLSVRAVPGLAISALALIAAATPARGDPLNVVFSFATTCNVAIQEGNTCTATFTITNPATNQLNVYLSLTSITSSAGDLANPTGEDPASIQAGGLVNPCFYHDPGNPAAPGQSCSETATITTNIGGDGETGATEPDSGTTTFTAQWRGLTLNSDGGTPTGNSATEVFSVVVFDPGAKNVPTPTATLTVSPEPASLYLIGTGLVGLASPARRKLRRR
jgi:hypothetical protein